MPARPTGHIRMPDNSRNTSPTVLPVLPIFQFTAMAARTEAPPHLSPGGIAKLDAFLKETVESGVHPAIHLGATTREGTIYFAQYGDRVHGQPERGQVGDETRS